MAGENPVEPLEKLEFLRGFRPRPVIKAAAHDPEQRALPAYGQPRFRRDHRPPLSTLGLTRFGGHPESLARGAADAKNTSTIFAGVSPTDGRPRPCWT